jgi:hypothetical protein
MNILNDFLPISTHVKKISAIVTPTQSPGAMILKYLTLQYVKGALYKFELY